MVGVLVILKIRGYLAVKVERGRRISLGKINLRTLKSRLGRDRIRRLLQLHFAENGVRRDRALLRKMHLAELEQAHGREFTFGEFFL